MKPVVVSAAAALILLGAPVASRPAPAASPFDGLWVDDLKTQMGEAGFDTYLVANGVYTCKSCRPPRSYPADGKMRPVPGDLSVLSESATVTGPRTLLTRLVDHEMARETTMTVAPDGTSATYVSLDAWPGRTRRLGTEYRATRVASAPPGAHAVSGSWRGVANVAFPEEYRSVTLHEAAGLFTRSNFRHGRYTARINGAPAPVTDDGKNIYQATVRAPNPHTRVEMILLQGKPVVKRTYTLSPDSCALTTIVSSAGGEEPFSTVAHRK
ncbi:MAG TPA: hypothetical protein VGC56_12150 [Allosphingosinicella sp.]|jgi:hypothetical protein